jgi:alpha-1,2-mannosyltransferase
MAVLGMLCVLSVMAFWIGHANAKTPGDTINYILAGLRLNVGHPLYGYGPGDQHIKVFELGPDYPIYSPPLIAIIFRAVVLLPSNGMYIWWVAMDALELLAVGMLLRRAPLVVGICLIPLSIPVGMVMEVANVDCLVVFGMLFAWLWLRDGRDGRAALVIAAVASLKLTPVIFVWWLWVTGRRKAAAIAIAGGIVLALVAMLGSEPLVFLKFYQVTTANLDDPISWFGPVGIARALGAPEIVLAWLPRVILVGGVAAIWLLRKRPGLSFAIAAAMMWLASPVAVLHTPALILVAFAPLAWPMARDATPVTDVAPVTTPAAEPAAG